MASIDPRLASTSPAATSPPPAAPAPPEVISHYARAHFDKAFERAGVGMALIALDGRFLRVNEAMASIMGRESSELMATSWPDIAHPDSRGTIRGFMTEALAGRATRRDDEMTFLKGNGQTGCALFSISLVTDDEGRMLFFFAQMFDVSERKALDRELEEKTSWVKLLQLVAVAANAAATFEEAMRAAVDAVCEETGWPVGHVFRVQEDGLLKPTAIWHLTDPEAYGDFRARSETVLLDPGEGLPGQVIETGAARWMNDVSTDESFIRREAARAAGLRAALAFPVKLEDRLVAVMEFFSDRNERPDQSFLEVMEHIGTLLGHSGEHRLVEEALVDNEERTRQILETAGDAFIEMDTGGMITDWNSRASESFGWTRDEVIGRLLCKTIIPERYRDAHNRGLQHYLETGEGPLLGKRIEIAALRRDGSEMPIELTLWSTTTAGVTTFNAFLHDITERVESHRALEEANRKLQVWVEELERRNKEINELIETREDLHALTLRDPLTNLFNRRYMEEALDQEIQRATRNNNPLGIIMIDIDHFKEINDTHGHEAGDVVLKTLADFLSDNIRAGDIACRYGGEEFLLIFPDAPLKATRQRADNLREAVNALEITMANDRFRTPTMSFGVAAFPRDGSTRQALLRAADAALYRAKNSGRNRVVSAGELL